MIQKSGNAPAHAIRRCAGALILCTLAGACEKGGLIGRGDRTLELSGDTIQLATGITLHDVKVTAAGNGFAPAQIKAKTGDVIRFTSDDNATHALVIAAPTDAATGSLQRDGQLRSPPLVAKGQAWVISLEDLPAGRYTITCISHPGAAAIQIE